jgi:hypothetical protein
MRNSGIGNNRFVLIVAPSDDLHALTVKRRIEGLGGHAFILDTEDFPSRSRLSLELNARSASRASLSPNDELSFNSDVAGVWWRRPRKYGVSPLIVERHIQRFVQLEARETFEGWLGTIGDRVINPLAAEAAATKPLQLETAGRIGIRIPDSLVTNCPIRAKQFVESHPAGVVYKTLTGTDWQVTETRRFTPDDFKNLQWLKYCPVIFQEEISNKRDIRVTVIDNDLFAAEIWPRHPEARLDWRLEPAAKLVKHQLPDAVSEKILEIIRALGLRFGAVDLALTDTSEYCFFEVNPSGQWLFMEIQLGYPLSEILARRLSGI